MCGRFVQARELTTLAQDLGAEIKPGVPGPSFNVAPTQQIAMLVNRVEDERESLELHPARWGLLPPWAKDLSGPPLINARIETVLEKPSFRDAASKRCVIPISGYFEWQQLAGEKRPHYIYAPADDAADRPQTGILLAGLYRWWRPATAASGSPWLLSATTLTKSSAAVLAEIHDRNPVMLSADTMADWLNPKFKTDSDFLAAVAAASDSVASGLSWHRVGASVGSVRNNGPELILAV
jgi:putative SOS response-associated peptidase YedK